ncbi:hypothetical protein [Rheinheimera hassiensis]|uniref:hypothetical protein n=1 Tax=Rheinheimera hassiensis TaxID=1193627 RepID=UPI001F06ADAB|nr:hypothetical protein [Rheinheimera hassiensis]
MQMSKITILIHTLILVGASVLISKYMTMTELEKYAAANPQPRIAVVDFDNLVKSKLDKGEDPVKVLKHVQMITIAAMADGYLLLDKQYVTAAAPAFILPDIPYDRLEQVLKERGLTPVSDAAAQSELNTTKQSLDELLKK